MELKRHIDKWLLEWKGNRNHKPALVRGIRQSGKTHSIRLFAENHYQVVIYLNFWDRPDLIDVFDGELDADTIIRELSVKMPLPQLQDGTTVFIYDEVQECPRALLSLKTAANEKRFDFIASGSYLGVTGYVVSDDTPKPVGCTDEFDMRTLDFEEFLWAKGYTNKELSYIREAFETQKPLSKSMHGSFTSLFREYLCIGGFPEAVCNYLETNNIYSTIQITRRITRNLQDDFGRRRGRDNRPLFNANEVARIRSAFSLIPSFLGKENKRFILSKITGKGAKDAGKDALDYLKDAGVIMKVHNLHVPATPLSVNVIQNQYKVFATDIGMLVGMLEDGTTDAILSGKLGMGKGVIYESIIADALYKRGGRVFYFSKESRLELDFVINYHGESTILEVKAANGNTKSAKTVMANPDHYGETRLIRIKDSNLSVTDSILTIPHYMAFLLFEWRTTLPTE
ncbi:MAG: ATP-binding protein [Clostridia bacterium]|nr:ATP-binding protein [Clostridia bacterium]MBQ6425860.1 ATP-binding protein [Clostridia bacterium]MBR0444038.1 ATP-binding protein [Clostridia bacterium]